MTRIIKTNEWFFFCRDFNSPPKHQLWVLGHILFHQVIKQRLQDVREVLQFTVQGHSQQRGHISSISRRKCALHLQSVNKLKRPQENKKWEEEKTIFTT